MACIDPGGYAALAVDSKTTRIVEGGQSDGGAHGHARPEADPTSH